ncbi:hypothetical protein A0256_23335 [Mucilaginibacter sp. PAMC 26640]|nr:hypothetical protein A0256_23335 [Mucilaginibacter sp. PAMC 26640]
MDNKRTFDTGSIRDNDTDKPLVNHFDSYTRLRFGHLLRKGANNYGKGNWKKGQPNEAALESLHRHLAYYEEGLLPEEDHLSAIIFNVQLILMNEKSAGVEVDRYK